MLFTVMREDSCRSFPRRFCLERPFAARICNSELLEYDFISRNLSAPPPLRVSWQATLVHGILVLASISSWRTSSIFAKTRNISCYISCVIYLLRLAKLRPKQLTCEGTPDANRDYTAIRSSVFTPTAATKQTLLLKGCSVSFTKYNSHTEKLTIIITLLQ